MTYRTAMGGEDSIFAFFRLLRPFEGLLQIANSSRQFCRNIYKMSFHESSVRQVAKLVWTRDGASGEHRMALPGGGTLYFGPTDDRAKSGALVGLKVKDTRGYTVFDWPLSAANVAHLAVSKACGKSILANSDDGVALPLSHVVQSNCFVKCLFQRGLFKVVLCVKFCEGMEPGERLSKQDGVLFQCARSILPFKSDPILKHTNQADCLNIDFIWPEGGAAHPVCMNPIKWSAQYPSSAAMSLDWWPYVICRVDIVADQKACVTRINQRILRQDGQELYCEFAEKKWYRGATPSCQRLLFKYYDRQQVLDCQVLTNGRGRAMTLGCVANTQNDSGAMIWKPVKFLAYQQGGKYILRWEIGQHFYARSFSENLRFMNFECVRLERSFDLFIHVVGMSGLSYDIMIQPSADCLSLDFFAGEEKIYPQTSQSPLFHPTLQRGDRKCVQDMMGRLSIEREGAQECERTQVMLHGACSPGAHSMGADTGYSSNPISPVSVCPEWRDGYEHSVWPAPMAPPRVRSESFSPGSVHSMGADTGYGSNPISPVSVCSEGSDGYAHYPATLTPAVLPQAPQQVGYQDGIMWQPVMLPIFVRSAVYQS